MCVSQNSLTPVPLKLPPPQFPSGYHRSKHKSDNGQPRYHVVKYSTLIEVEKDEATGKEKMMIHKRVFFDGKGVGELNDYLACYPEIDVWRIGSAFGVEIFSGGEWKKIYSPPY